MQLHDAEAHDIILDSGADMSCLPLSYAEHGTSHGSSGLQLRDAQGEALAVNDLREVEFVVQSEEGEPIVWREVCAVAPLRSRCCVKARLMHAGWWPQRRPRMCLEHDSGVRVPMSFKRELLVRQGSHIPSWRAVCKPGAPCQVCAGACRCQPG